MTLFVWNDGMVVEASEFRLVRPYVLQRIHTLGYKAYNLDRHIQLLRDASCELFGFASLCRKEDAERIIAQLLYKSRVSVKFSCPVVMRLDSEGHLSFEVESPGYYTGASLRMRRPTAATLTVSRDVPLSQNSTTVAEDLMCDCRVRGCANVAMLVDANGEVISRPWQPVFAVYHNKIYTPAEYDTVEYLMARNAIVNAEIEFIVHPLPVSSLARMDEIFIVDTMGVTSFSQINHHRLLSVIATLVANKMESK